MGDLGRCVVGARGVLCPQMYGLALGLYDRNLGLVGGIVSAGCHLLVSVSMAVVGVLPERSQAPLRWMYIACGTAAFGSLVRAMARVRDMTTKEH